MPEQIEMTVRQLPDGEPYGMKEIIRKGRSIEIELLEEAPNLASGALVEISSTDVLYLGEVQARQGSRLSVMLEHAVDRAKVLAIQALWT
jgi:hypothetical protein